MGWPWSRIRPPFNRTALIWHTGHRSKFVVLAFLRLYWTALWSRSVGWRTGVSPRPGCETGRPSRPFAFRSAIASMLRCAPLKGHSIGTAPALSRTVAPRGEPCAGSRSSITRSEFLTPLDAKKISMIFRPMSKKLRRCLAADSHEHSRVHWFRLGRVRKQPLTRTQIYSETVKKPPPWASGRNLGQ